MNYSQAIEIIKDWKNYVKEHKDEINQSDILIETLEALIDLGTEFEIQEKMIETMAEQLVTLAKYNFD